MGAVGISSGKVPPDKRMKPTSGAPRPQARNESDLHALQRRQDLALRLIARAPISGFQEAERFLSEVGIALRYGPTRGLPLASLYLALAGPKPHRAALSRGIALTNRLLGEAHAIEVHVISDRVALIHRSLMPSLYTLVRRGRALDDLGGLSVHARTAFALLGESREVTAGDVRRRLGLPFNARRDPAYAALGELERVLLVDRGPFQIPKSGIPYLSSEGYPYHFFHEAHPDLAAASARHSVASAADAFLKAYLDGAVFARVRKLATLFKVFLAPEEIAAALQRLAKNGKLDMRGIGRDTIVVSMQRPPR